MSREQVPTLLRMPLGMIKIIPDESIKRGWFKLKGSNRIEMHPLDYREVLAELDKRDAGVL